MLQWPTWWNEDDNTSWRSYSHSYYCHDHYYSWRKSQLTDLNWRALDSFLLLRVSVTQIFSLAEPPAWQWWHFQQDIERNRIAVLFISLPNIDLSCLQRSEFWHHFDFHVVCIIYGLSGDVVIPFAFLSFFFSSKSSNVAMEGPHGLTKLRR